MNVYSAADLKWARRSKKSAHTSSKSNSTSWIPDPGKKTFLPILAPKARYTQPTPRLGPSMRAQPAIMQAHTLDYVFMYTEHFSDTSLCTCRCNLAVNQCECHTCHSAHAESSVCVPCCVLAIAMTKQSSPPKAVFGSNAVISQYWKRGHWPVTGPALNLPMMTLFTKMIASSCTKGETMLLDNCSQHNRIQEGRN